MPRALAIETSGRVGSVALADGGKVLDEATFPHGLKHAAEIIPLIDRLCRQHTWSARDLEQVYVSAGPGSFTGLRIGITLAKTLALATGVRVVSVPTAEVIVENAPAEANHAIVVLDAKKDQIYTARFERVNGAWETREGAHLDSLTAMLGRAPRPVWLVGEGIPWHKKFVPEDARVRVAEEELWRPRAGVVARLGWKYAERGEFADAYKLTPIYIRPPEPEEKLMEAERLKASQQSSNG